MSIPTITFGIVRRGRGSVAVLLAVLCLASFGGKSVHAQVADSAAVDSLPDDSVTAPPAAPPDSVRSQDVGAGEQRDTYDVSADSLSTIQRDGERLQELLDNVFVKDDTTRLRSNFALRYLERDEVLFTGDVVIYERGDTLRADTVRYNKQTKVGHARGHVRLTDGEVVVRAPRATYYTREKRSVFPDSVTLVDSSRVLRAQMGTYWSNEQRAEFRGHVRLTDPETYLESDSLTYFRDEDRSIAVGEVFLRREETNETEGRQQGTDSTAVVSADTTSRTYLFGDWVDNQEQRQYSRVEGRAVLVRVRMDSTGAPEDTLAVRAHQLEAIRTETYRRLIAVDSVRIWQSDLAAVADSAVYDRVLAAGEADSARAPAPLPDSDPTPPTPEQTYASVLDSLVAETEPPALAGPVAVSKGETKMQSPPVDSTVAASRDVQVSPPDAGGRASRSQVQDPSSRAPDQGRPSSSRTRHGARVWDRPAPRSEEDTPLEETRLFQAPVTWFEQAQVWGDSIRVRAHERSLDTVFVRGAAFAAQQDTTIDRIQQLKGKDITAFFRRDSLRRIQAEPNAQAIRFLTTEQGALKGAAKASGDRIVLRFRENSVKRVSVIGGVESSYYRSPDDIPNPFQLSGFQWTPDRKPTKQGLLRTPRIRERLGLDTQSRPPLDRRRRAAGPPGPPQEGAASSSKADEEVEPGRGTGASDGLYRPDSLQRPARRPEAADTTATSSEPDSE
ncbi:hypothetical protein BSZ35_02560 [Salinibacter sp. 10B]|nr:hypothetical protein BSZ35_02560 [Salinibacter sp. 10B]